MPAYADSKFVLENICSDLQDTTVDYLVGNNGMRFNVNMSMSSFNGLLNNNIGLQLVDPNQSDQPLRILSQSAHKIVAKSCCIPRHYYQKLLKEHPQLLCNIITETYPNITEPIMVRTGKTNAGNDSIKSIFSNSYDRINDLDVADNVRKWLDKTNNIFEVSNYAIGEVLYIKLSSDSFQYDVKVNDPVRFGFIITNSECGKAPLSVKLFIHRLVCQNGMVSDTDYNAITKRHRSSRLYIRDSNLRYERLDPPIYSLTNDLYDSMSQMSNKAMFERIIAMFENSVKNEVKDPDSIFDNMKNKKWFTESEFLGIQGEFFSADDYTQWGMANAITAYAKHVEDPYRRTELETIGFNVSTMEDKYWGDLIKTKVNPKKLMSNSAMFTNN